MTTSDDNPAGPPEPPPQPESAPPIAPPDPMPRRPAPEPASFPRGFWSGLDYMLHHPDEVLESLRRDEGLWAISKRLLAISIVTAALYGAVMGATNLLQGADQAIHFKLAQIAVAAIKVPVLFLLTLLIVLPPVYISNTFLGARLSFGQMLALLLGATAITGAVLASMATVAFFFALTTKTYDFLKLLHVLFFAYAGLAGVAYLKRSVDAVSLVRGGRGTGRVFVLMMILYAFVGTQLAWVLRPFVSSPNEPFQVFRPRSGNFYESVGRSTNNLFEKVDAAGNSTRR